MFREGLQLDWKVSQSQVGLNFPALTDLGGVESVEDFLVGLDQSLQLEGFCCGWFFHFKMTKHVNLLLQGLNLLISGRRGKSVRGLIAQMKSCYKRHWHRGKVKLVDLSFHH